MSQEPTANSQECYRQPWISEWVFFSKEPEKYTDPWETLATTG
jgi:hypothetical protein